MPLRFDIDYDDPGIAWEPLVDEVFGELTSSFLEMPKGEGFIDYPTFEKGYQALKRQTDSFAALTPENVLAAVREVPIAFIVFRCILGFSPPEWAYITTEMTGVDVDQGAARSIDRKFRMTCTRSRHPTFAAVDSAPRWAVRHRQAQSLLITADAGGSNGARLRARATASRPHASAQ